MAKIKMLLKKQFILFILILLILPFIFAQEQLSFDGFESGNFCGGSGWIDNCWTTSGSVSIVGWSSPYEGNRHTWLRSNNALLTRTIDISGYSDVVVKFAVKINSLESTDKSTFRVAVDGGNYINIKEWTSVDSDSTWHYYTFNLADNSVPLGNVLTLNFFGQMSDLGDETHIDSIMVEGTFGVTPEVAITMDNNYQVGQTDVVISLSSTETEQLHTLKLYDQNDQVFCEKNLISPSVAKTTFSVLCDMPSTTQTDARAEFYLTNTPSLTTEHYFNVLSLDNDFEMLKIKQVYFSPQVLQGGTTEIFVVIEKNPSINLSSLKTTLIYPDGEVRILGMESTVNNNEYRVFITDTFRTGNTTFTIRVEADNYYDSYTNYYTITPYNINFVELVNQVSEVLNVKTVESVKKLDITTMDIHGTEYFAGQKGKTFLQLLDGDSQPVTNSSCFTSIYYPNGIVWKYQQSMSYLDEGIYNYDFTVPYQSGVYPVSAFCTLPSLDVDEKEISDDFNSGLTSGGSNWATDWTQSGQGLCYYETGNVYEGAYSIECYNDRTFSRTFESNSSYATLDYSFFWRADDLEVGETVYYQIIDASSNVYTLLSVTDGDDDGVYHSETGTLSVTADNFDFDGTLTFQMTTANNLENTDYYNIDLLDITLNAPTEVNTTAYQIVRGSGEIHVTTDNGEYYPILLYGELTNKSFEEDFTFHYDVISQTSQNKTGQKIELTLWKPFPCNHIINITESLTNGTLEVLEYSGSTDVLGRCVVNVEIDLNVGKTHDIEIVSENYWKKQTYYDYSLALLQSEMINISCQNYILSNGLPNITIPLSTIPYGSDAMWLSCASYLDEYYHYTEIVQTFLALVNTNANFTLIEMEGLESLWRLKIDILHNLDTHASKIFDGLNLGSSYSLGLLTDPYPPTNPLYATYFASISTSYLDYASTQTIPTKVWNYSTRNLTEYPTFSLDINYTLISDDVWNYENRTLTQNISGGSVNINTTQLVNDVWNYTGTINDNILSQVSTSIWEFTYRYIHGEDRS